MRGLRVTGFQQSGDLCMSDHRVIVHVLGPGKTSVEAVNSATSKVLTRASVHAGSEVLQHDRRFDPNRHRCSLSEYERELGDTA
jgi:hypothetical protein